MTDDSKKVTRKDSSADNVDQHLQELESSNDKNLKTVQIEEQSFSEAELARLVNTKKLYSLLNSSDDFLSHLGGEIEGFDKDNFK